jgi:hypothetical protein
VTTAIFRSVRRIVRIERKCRCDKVIGLEVLGHILSDFEDVLS